MAGETIGDEPIESLGAVAGVLGVEVAVDG
jgi:hypothetical protein